MSTRELTYLAIPLALTILLPVAFGLHWPLPICWSLLGVLTFSWLIYSWWSLRWGKRFYQDRAQMVQERAAREYALWASVIENIKL